MGISKDILESFELTGEIVPLRGGQNTSVKVGNAVLKPVDDTSYAECLSNIIYNINPQGYRISKPIRNKDGTFVSKGWACTQYEQGEDVKGRIQEKLLVSRMFHRDLSHLHIRDLPYTDNPWSRGHRIAWQIDPLPMDMPEAAKEIINTLLNRVSLRKNYKVQMVHADLSGNILFDQKLSPLVIDFSPTIAPVEYAEAILVCDCIAWQGSSVSEILLLPDDEFHKEMLIRAVVFRLAVSAIFSQDEINTFVKEYEAYKPIMAYCKID